MNRGSSSSRAKWSKRGSSSNSSSSTGTAIGAVKVDDDIDDFIYRYLRDSYIVSVSLHLYST